MSSHPFSEGIFPNIQSKPLLVQPEAISFGPVADYLGGIGAISISED